MVNVVLMHGELHGNILLIQGELHGECSANTDDDCLLSFSLWVRFVRYVNGSTYIAALLYKLVFVQNSFFGEGGGGEGGEGVC